MTYNGQSPKAEVLERMAESSPLGFLPRAIAAEDMRRQLASYQMRVDASQAMGLAALGFGDYADKVFDASTQANSSMGGITIHGDTHQYLYGNVPQQQTQPATQPAAQPAQGGLSKWLAPTLLGAALAGGGAGSYALWDYFSNEEPTPVVQQPADQDWKLGVEVRDR